MDFKLLGLVKHTQDFESGIVHEHILAKFVHILVSFMDDFHNHLVIHIQAADLEL